MAQMQAAQGVTVIGSRAFDWLSFGDFLIVKGDPDRKVYFANWANGSVFICPVQEDGAISRTGTFLGSRDTALLLFPPDLGISRIIWAE